MAANWKSIEGTPFPLGAPWVEEDRAFNFALYSKHGEWVELLLYAETDLGRPRRRFRFDFLKNKSGPIWHCRIPGPEAEGCRFYAYRVEGSAPEPGFAWHVFDSQKLLFDPYARSIYFPPGFDREAARQPDANEGQAPLGVLIRGVEPFEWGGDHPIRHTSDLIIYELHVKGFTADGSSGVAPHDRGMFAGVIEKIPYLQELGVMAVELMPVFQFDPQDGNYWGYMPERRGPLRHDQRLAGAAEFRDPRGRCGTVAPRDRHVGGKSERLCGGGWRGGRRPVLRRRRAKRGCFGARVAGRRIGCWEVSGGFPFPGRRV